MTSLFAQAAIDGDLIVKLLAIALVVGQVVAIWLSLSNRKDIQKREVSFGFEPASKENFDRLVEDNSRDHRDIFAKIGGVDRGSAAKISAEVTSVHIRVNALEKSVGGLETASDLTNQQLARVEAKIDRLIERRP